MNITINVPNELGERIASLPNRDRFVTRAITKELEARKLDNIKSLEDLVRLVSENAKKRGLTEGKLNQLLND